MKKYRAKKRLGQNFIKDKNLLLKIAGSIEYNQEDLVIEIGMGQGDLTRAIMNYDPNYIGYEIDKDLKEYLEPLRSEKRKILYENFLKSDVLTELKEKKYNNLYIISNVPYYITSAIITKIIKDKLPVKKMVLLVQKEVAERFSAMPKSREYGSMTVYLNYYFNIKKLFSVNRKSFNPIPDVDSELILLESIKGKIIVEDEKFEKLLKDSFQFKRKTIKNNLKNYDLSLIEKILIKNNLSLTSRAEEIPVDVFIEICNEIT